MKTEQAKERFVTSYVIALAQAEAEKVLFREEKSAKQIYYKAELTRLRQIIL